MRHLWIIGVIALVAGCEKPAERESKAGPPGPLSAGAAPAAPDWASAFAGQAYAAAFPTAQTCQSAVDGVPERTPQTARVVGWSWSPELKSGYPHIVLVDAAGNMVAYGDSGDARPDVPAALKTVTRPDVGWHVVAPAKAGTYAVYGIDPAAKAGCRLGEITL